MTAQEIKDRFRSTQGPTKRVEFLAADLIEKLETQIDYYKNGLDWLQGEKFDTVDEVQDGIQNVISGYQVFGE